jgi:quercetin dioxygenase-like cupin family protein
MDNINLKTIDLIGYSEKGILSKVIVKNDKFDITLFSMAEGTEISEHTATKQGFVYVIEGKGVFSFKEEDIAMSPGVFIYLKENTIHSLKVNKNTSFILALNNA